MHNTSENIVYKHHEAINSQDETGYLNTVKFPFTYQNYNGVSITIKDKEDYKINYKMPWDIIKETEEIGLIQTWTKLKKWHVLIHQVFIN